MPAAAAAVGILADMFSQATAPEGEGELGFVGKSAGALALSLSGRMDQLDSDPETQRRLGINVSKSEWTAISERHGQPLPRPPSAREKTADAADMWVKAELSKTYGQSMKDGRLQPHGADAGATAATATAAAATGWSKPSLQLNSLQRIGAAVSQSADPIAIEKDNNKLLKNIAKNTKKTADNVTSDEL